MKMAFLILCLIPIIAGAQYNFESCTGFWKLTDKIRSGLIPTAQEWDSLRETPGYKRKNISASRWKAFTDKVEFVFTPGNETAAAERAAKDISYIPILSYLREEAQLKNYVNSIQTSGFIDSAVSRARHNLPLNSQQCFPRPTIYFLLYDYDGSATNQHVLIDLLISYHTDQCGTALFAGHEVYHYATSYCRIKQKRFKKNPLTKHQGVFLAVHAISEEATADLIDKHQIIFSQQCSYLYRDTFITYQEQQSPQLILAINKGLEQLADDKEGEVKTIAFWMKLIPWAAHIPGTYISQVIRNAGLEKEMIYHANNAFKVFYLYNEAAALDAHHPPLFSGKAIRFLKSLERKYIR